MPQHTWFEDSGPEDEARKVKRKRKKNKKRTVGACSNFGMNYYYPSSRSGHSAPLPCVLSSGTEDALLMPDCSRSLCSLTRCSAQGHTVHLNEKHPNIILQYDNDQTRALCLVAWR